MVTVSEGYSQGSPGVEVPCPLCTGHVSCSGGCVSIRKCSMACLHAPATVLLDRTCSRTGVIYKLVLRICLKFYALQRIPLNHSPFV